MRNIVTLAAALVLPLLAATSHAACTLEAEPVIPDGKTATQDDLKAAVAGIKAYQVKLKDYRKCLDDEAKAAEEAAPKDETEDAKKARAAAATAAFNQSVEKEEALVAKYVEARKAYNAAHPSK